MSTQDIEMGVVISPSPLYIVQEKKPSSFFTKIFGKSKKQKERINPFGVIIIYSIISGIGLPLLAMKYGIIPCIVMAILNWVYMLLWARVIAPDLSEDASFLSVWCYSVVLIISTFTLVMTGSIIVTILSFILSSFIMLCTGCSGL